MDPANFKIFLIRVRWASSEARSAAQTVRGLALAVLVGSGSGFFASQTEHPSVVLVVGAALLGLFAPLVLVFVWSFLTIPRRHLEWRTEELEEKIESLQEQMTELVEEKHGDPFQFLPVYHELRSDIREAIRIINHAKKSGRLWSRAAAPEYRHWKRHREEIASNPFARLDGMHGELLEAFDHIERLAKDTSLRFGRRGVRRSDDLDVALKSLKAAEECLTASIKRLETLQAPPELWQSEDTHQ